MPPPTLSTLPPELTLKILTFLPRVEVWDSIRFVSRQFNSLADDIFRTLILPDVTFCLDLPSGLYDSDSENEDSDRKLPLYDQIVLHFLSAKKQDDGIARYKLQAISPADAKERVYAKLEEKGGGVEKVGIMLKIDTLCLMTPRRVLWEIFLVREGVRREGGEGEKEYVWVCDWKKMMSYVFFKKWENWTMGTNWEYWALRPVRERREWPKNWVRGV